LETFFLSQINSEIKENKLFIIIIHLPVSRIIINLSLICQDKFL